MIDKQDSPRGSSSFLSPANPIPLNQVEDVKGEVILVDNERTLDLDDGHNTRNIGDTETCDISVSCVMPPVPLIEEETRKAGHVQASVYR